jgi:hypothetical protein
MIERIINFFRPKPVERKSVMGEAFKELASDVDRKFRKGCKSHSVKSCPICNHRITIVGRTISGRMVASCGDAFHEAV